MTDGYMPPCCWAAVTATPVGQSLNTIRPERCRQRHQAGDPVRSADLVGVFADGSVDALAHVLSERRPRTPPTPSLRKCPTMSCPGSNSTPSAASRLHSHAVAANGIAQHVPGVPVHQVAAVEVEGAARVAQCQLGDAPRCSSEDDRVGSTSLHGAATRERRVR
ncbi:hypothetical protein SACE_2782 [Saccharopolyspora erythraea NRRL 2338]|uniref:Uncharacterized protein n=1 Tax=Saccharopolyspora erythraea (strain ATCC 11635 / DSM 40517 / JCM 4748 / NBRC 13426 / NCIMB 8594 / NRRL 2338) TaxID=405948 RepID=A4FDD8_SACEN|nr:hypothetical protein SACE_2782 [Saccharopolyspora erythraea NRRL 2338]